MMSLMVSFCAVFFPRDVLDEIWDLIESVSGGFSYLLFQNFKLICESDGIQIL